MRIIALIEEADVIYNNIVSWPQPLDVVAALSRLVKQDRVKLTVLDMILVPLIEDSPQRT